MGSKDYQSSEVTDHIIVGWLGKIAVILRLDGVLSQACFDATPVHEYLRCSPLSMWESDGAMKSGPSGRISNHEADMTTCATMQVNYQYQQTIFNW